MSKNKKKNKQNNSHAQNQVQGDECLKCETCDQPLTKSGGYSGTGMCGPCATGEADTFGEIGDTW